jgi:hypothetical protein
VSFFACLAWAAAPAQALKTEFHYTDDEQEFTVPAGVHLVKVFLVGGTGGASGAVAGGEAMAVSSGLLLTPGETLYIEVGGRGQSEAEGGEGGFNGGGEGGGGGGGASDIRTSPRSVPLSTEDTRLVIAAGGGGAGATGSESGTKGGNAGAPGESGFYSGGGAGTETEGGAGAVGCFETAAGSGELGLGGDGGFVGVFTGPGGGGGGGLYGGGGGAGACEVGSSGGGGGSSFEGLQTLTSGEPEITITWNPPPSVTITTPDDEATYTQGDVVNANYSCLPGEGTTLKSCSGTVENGEPVNTATTGEHSFTVEAEDNDKGTAIETVSYTVVPKEEPGPGPQPTPPAPQPVPNTTLGKHPKKTIKSKKKKVKVKFSFSSDVAGATFQCKLDKKSFAPCTSPKTYKVKRGKHTFSVEAIGTGGTDATPATFKFKVKKKK